MATKAVEENIKKARKSIFLYGGIGVFLGDLGPLSSRSAVEVCVMPILLFCCDNWIVSKKLLRQLESFQGEMGKGLPRCTSNTAVGIVMGWPSMHARILVQKLGFFKEIGIGKWDKLGSRMLRLLVDDRETVSLVCECRELEEAFGTSFTDRILEAEEGEGPHPREIRKEITGRDQTQRMDRCSQEDRAPAVVEIAQVVQWEKLWDTALDEGPHCIQWMKRLVKALCHQCFGDKRDCPHEHIDISQELINCLANTDFNYFLRTHLSFVTFPPGVIR